MPYDRSGARRLDAEGKLPHDAAREGHPLLPSAGGSGADPLFCGDSSRR